MTEETTQVSCAETGATTDAHKKLEPFVGTFRAEVKMWMGPGEPTVSSGSMTNRMELGGRYLHQIYKGDGGEGPFAGFEGRGYWGFNTATGEYEGMWIDTASTFLQTEQGGVDAAGRVWTMKGTIPDPQGGGTCRKRSVITLVDDDHHTMEMFFKGPDGNEAKAMEITYARSG